MSSTSVSSFSLPLLTIGSYSTTSAGASSPRLVARWKHDVFLSFTGHTRSGFTGHLYDALIKKEINTYRDDQKLPIGKVISSELLQSIEESKFAIVILSSDYATSTWCLDELAKIVECMKERELILIPVFYYVDPSDVRRQRKSFQQAFAKHEEDPEIIPEKVKTWRSAFKEVGDIVGLHIDGKRCESEDISEIVRRISQDLQDALPRDVTKGLVGIESRVQELNRLLCETPNEVWFIGICGMSGVGKTTLAEVVFEKFRYQFDGYSFLENIKNVSKKSDGDLCKLQQKLLNDILRDENIRVRSVIEGVSIMQKRLRGLKILLILDDVNHRDQLTFLSREREWFGHGSKIIITTTNEDLLTSHRVDGICRCEVLNFDNALKLFCMFAFAEGQPKHGYEKLSNDIVELSGGLPLALNVFGSLLFGKEEEYWRDTLEKLQQCPEEAILERLEICYGRLDRNEQDIFIYIACFLKGKDLGLVKDILKNIGLSPIRGIDILINRSLITVDYDDSVCMHDLLQQTVWEILRKKSPGNPGKHTGIKSRQDIVDILTSKVKGSVAIEIINQESYGVEVENCIGYCESFSEMTKLKFLRISNVIFPNGLKYLSNDLRILEWYGCSLKSLPSMFEPKQLYELDMRSSQIEKLWEKDIGLPNLRSIYLSQSKKLTEIPDLTSTPSLEKLNLEGCTNLVKVHQSVFVHQRLRYVNMKGCTRLESLGSNIIEMEALEALILSGCSSLASIPEFGEYMIRLEDLYLNGTKISKLPKKLGDIESLRKLDVSETDIVELPVSILLLNRLRLIRFCGCHLLLPHKSLLSMNLQLAFKCLRELDLSYCNLSVVPNGISWLSSLIELDLSGNDFVTLPASIRELSCLRVFRLNCCKRLQSLPELPIMNDNYEFLVRFSYYISGKELDISKFLASGDKIDYTVSCLNCPKLVENENGGGLADTILKKYLQVRTNFDVMPIAVIEIVAAGSEIPQWFHNQCILKSIWFELPPSWNDRTSACEFLQYIWFNHEGVQNAVAIDYDMWVKHQFTWIGLALCAVFVARHAPVIGTDAFSGVKYEIITHIHVAGRNWKIPIPVNFMEAGLENQLVWYWTLADDIQRAISGSQQNQLYITFTVKPEDGNLEVKKFGARFVNVQDFPEFEHNKFTHKTLPKPVISDETYLPEQEMVESEITNLELQYFDVDLEDRTMRVINTVALDVEVPSLSLNSLREVVKSLLENNQEVVNIILECKKEIWEDDEFFSFVEYYFYNSLEILDLCIALDNCLKRACDGLSIVQAELQQFENRGTQNYSRMLQQFKILKAAVVPFSEEFSILFQSVYYQQVSLLEHLPFITSKFEKTKEWVKVRRKVLYVIYAGTFSTELICLVLAMAIAAPPVVTAMAASAAVPQSSLGKWFYSVWKRCENEMKGEWKMIDSIQIRTCIVIKDLESIGVLVENMEMEWLLQNADFANRQREEMVMITAEQIKQKLCMFVNAAKDLSKFVHRCSLNMRHGITSFLEKHPPQKDTSLSLNS